MGKYVAQQIIKRLVKQKVNINTAKIGFLGFSYKEDSSDIRNTKVTDIIEELQEYGITTLVADPNVDKQQVYGEYGIVLCDIEELSGLNVVIVAVPHSQIMKMHVEDFDKLYDDNKTKFWLI